MRAEVDEDRLDDVDALARGDAGAALRTIALAAAQVRRSLRAANEADLSPLTVAGRPRAVVVAGAGLGRHAAAALAALCGTGCPTPVVPVSGLTLPGWAGTLDLVIAAGTGARADEETLGIAAEAARRGCRLAVVADAGSPLIGLAAQARAPVVPLQAAPIGAIGVLDLVVPLVVMAGQIGLLTVAPQVFEAAAELVEDLAHRCGPANSSFANPAKTLAVEMAGSLPMIWGTSALTTVAAGWLASRMAIAAKYPALAAELPPAGHDQIAAFDGPFAALSDEGDFFRDRVDFTPPPRLRLFVLREAPEDPRISPYREESLRIAARRGIHATEVLAEGDHPLQRLAWLLTLADYVSAYLALAYGIDPAPAPAVTELAGRISR